MHSRFDMHLCNALLCVFGIKNNSFVRQEENAKFLIYLMGNLLSGNYCMLLNRNNVKYCKMAYNILYN